MKHIKISIKIWLSIGIFILGTIVTTALGQLQGRHEEGSLRRTSDALFPAEQRTQQAQAAFDRAIRGFNQAVILQSASSLAQAISDGQSAVKHLDAIVGTPGLAAYRSKQAQQLSLRVAQLVQDARVTYGEVLRNPGDVTPETRAQMHDLAQRTNSLYKDLEQATENFSQDLHRQLNVVQAESAGQ